MGGATVEETVVPPMGVVLPVEPGAGGVINAPVGGWKKGTVGLLTVLSSRLQPM